LADLAQPAFADVPTPPAAGPHPYLRLRQICLAAPALAPAEAAIEAILGLTPCHRDPAVAAYGLENVLYAFGAQFLEVVAPTRDGTAAGRFIARSGGRGAYMAIFDCHDPAERRTRALAQGVRLAHGLSHPGFWGSQLHPRDCRATMLEFDRSEGGEALDGAYWPAGPHWQAHVRTDRVSGIPAFGVESPDPDGLAAHWGALMDRPVTLDANGQARLRFDLAEARFGPPGASAPDDAERVVDLHITVPDPTATLAAARQAGCRIEADGFWLAGARWVPVR
jgi:hypothetical protein